VGNAKDKAENRGNDRGRERVEAAGGVVWRVHDGVVEVLLVHRPKYDDWSLPKGKLEPGESYERAAEREVQEETGLRCNRGPELDESHYVDNKGRSKVVRYWMMEVLDGAFERNDEVDEVRWMPAGEADGLLTYPRDRPVLVSFERTRRQSGRGPQADGRGRSSS
jgi:8-oxo-dGTP diphosphatase